MDNRSGDSLFCCCCCETPELGEMLFFRNTFSDLLLKFVIPLLLFAIHTLHPLQLKYVNPCVWVWGVIIFVIFSFCDVHIPIFINNVVLRPTATSQRRNLGGLTLKVRPFVSDVGRRSLVSNTVERVVLSLSCSLSW